MKFTQGKIIAITLVVGLGVLIAFLPHKPGKEQPGKEVLTLDSKVDKAVEIITQGKGSPMQGIKLLKEVIEEDPNNEKALYYLGNFSIQSGQYKKAINRFESLTKVNPSHIEGWYLLGYSFEMERDTNNAIKNYEFVVQSASNKEISKLAEEGINKLLKH
ncbi:MAG: hypothetical protein CL840_09425 [Crocinitomicaceae bacterium]|nr:hypothetical protein [Crocinitomicaceae bacterium]|tara:strand:- start:4091 stop:4570 length:480 start_codon:yes stop_codon:yes gene_type:complete